MKYLFPNRIAGVALWALSVVLVPTASADVVAVVNGSFEILPPGGLDQTAGCLNAGCFWSTSPIFGWTTTGGGGQFQPGLNGHFDTLSHGPVSAWSNGGTISQTVSPTVQAGTAYVLLVDVGQRKDTPFAASAGLIINGMTYQAVGPAPAAGGWSTLAALYIGTPADVGQSITIELTGDGVQGNFDDVRLFALPEPGDFMFLIAAAAVVLGMAVRGR